MIKYFLFLLYPLLLMAQNGVLLRVIDGDTLLLKTDEEFNICQISYIDTPEAIENDKLEKDLQGCQNITRENAISAGIKAKDFLASLVRIQQKLDFNVTRVLDNKNPVCDINIPQGVQIYINPTLSEVMLERGYALPFIIYADEKVKEKMLKIAYGAKQERRGLWKTHREFMMCLVKKRYSLRSLRD